MKFLNPLNDADRQLVETRLKGFVPPEIYDIHAHPYHRSHFGPDAWQFLHETGEAGCVSHREHLRRYMAADTIHGLYFGLPHGTADRPAINEWVAKETAAHGTARSRALLLASPGDDRACVADELRSGRFAGLKVYHCYADRPDTFNARIEEFAPEWMWELLDETRGVLMLHMVRDGAISDPGNQQSLRRLCRRYLKARLVLAHVARSFNYRDARAGLHAIADLDNAVVDTSAICESEAFAEAIKVLGPRRILWGSDFAVSELRGRCVTTGETFFWLHPHTIVGNTPTRHDLTLVGIESLLGLREAAHDAGLTVPDLNDIFLGNALRLLAPSLPSGAVPCEPDGPALWQRARQSISGGTGLLSKRAELFDSVAWPSYFSRASGCQVWDLEGRRHVDFAGGVGAVLLGYADPDVNAAVQRRIAAGSYCTLVSPQEVELAETLLGLHPWAGKVRFARGGGDAMAVAVRIARAASGRSGIAFCGYHGWHDWYLAANLGDREALNGHLLPGLDPKGVPRELAGTSMPFRYNDLGSLEAALWRLDGNLAAVVMEPMRSQWPEDDFLARAAELCRTAGAVFVIDEITSGLRYGFPGALSRLGVEPDLVVYAKAMGNGFPFATVIGREAVMQAADASFISSSYWTDGIGPAAALAVLEKTRRLRAHEAVWESGARLQASLRQLAARHPLCKLAVGGMPASPTMTFDLGADTPLAQALYVRKMGEHGLLVSSVFYLMLAHREEDLARFAETADRVLGEVGAIIEAGRLEVESGVKRGTRGFARLA